ncbi:MAG: hypothetical protein WBO47_11410 [Gammaproteobacteria bacterium]
MTTFWIIALAIALVGSALIVVPLMRSFFAGHEGDRHPGLTIGTGIAVALLMPVLALTLYARWSNWDWTGNTAGMAANAVEQAHTMGDAIASLESRLAAQPDDVEGWQMLGRSYMSTERFADAAGAYKRALELIGNDDINARTDYAEALFLSDPAGPNGSAGRMFMEMVGEAPDNPKVMWYGGFVSFETGQEQKGRELWSALLTRNPPEPIRRVIEERLAMPADMAGGFMPQAQTGPAEAETARTPNVPSESAVTLSDAAAASTIPEAVASTEADTKPAAAALPPPSGPDVIQLSIELSPALADRLSNPAPLFIFARGAAGGPPLAVVRRGSNELPMTIEMSDANAMMQGVQISVMPELQLVARVSLSGSPAAKPGDLFGEVKYSREAGQQATIVIDQVVE